MTATPTAQGTLEVTDAAPGTVEEARVKRDNEVRRLLCRDVLAAYHGRGIAITENEAQILVDIVLGAIVSRHWRIHKDHVFCSECRKIVEARVAEYRASLPGQEARVATSLARSVESGERHVAYLKSQMLPVDEDLVNARKHR